MVIETPNLDLSREIAKGLVEKDWMVPWIEKERGSILIAQVNQAETKYVEQMKV